MSFNQKKKLCEFELTEEEQRTLKNFIRSAKSEEVLADIETNSTLMQMILDEGKLFRFLRAREKNVEKALEMWRNWVKWFKETRPDKVTKHIVQEEIQLRKAFWFKQDNLNNPCLIVRIRNHIPLAEHNQRMTKFFMYIMEKGIKLAEDSNTHRFTVIWDGKGFSRAQLNSALFDFLKQATKMLSDFYPNRLFAVYLIDANYLVRFAYGILKPFINSGIVSKIHFIPQSDLLLHFSHSNLLEEYGGLCHENQLDNETKEITQIELQGSRYNQDINDSLESEDFQSLLNNSQLFFKQEDLLTKYPSQQIQEANKIEGIPILEEIPTNPTSCCSCSIF